MSGLVMNDSVEALPSLRPGKLRLNELTIVFVWSASDVGPLPLPDARTAGVGEDGATDPLERLHDAVALDRLEHALGARRDQELRLGRAARP